MCRRPPGPPCSDVSPPCCEQELCAALEAKEELYGTLVTKGQQLLTLSPEGLDSNTEQDLANLRDKWGAVRTKVAERKVR